MGQHRTLLVVAVALVVASAVADDWPWETLDNTATRHAGVPRWKAYRKNRGKGVAALHGIPRVLHRSHNLTVAQLAGFGRHDTTLGRRVAKNVASCATVNPKFETRWYEDRHLEGVLDAFAGVDPRLGDLVRALRAPPLASVFVLRADVARLALARGARRAGKERRGPAETPVAGTCTAAGGSTRTRRASTRSAPTCRRRRGASWPGRAR